ncbi:MAG: hypothetical protein R3185_09350, partial [Candidatus Thermoplasmatota archaeon]|nr:hypothetical protein [Candidatus Thermoplasmatota archaeon]
MVPRASLILQALLVLTASLAGCTGILGLEGPIRFYLDAGDAPADEQLPAMALQRAVDHWAAQGYDVAVVQDRD